MITEEKIRSLLEERFSEEGHFVVNVSVSSGNAIVVEIDNEEGFGVHDCTAVNRFLESEFDRDVEDFSLQVSTPGADQPLKVLQQYRKNVGRQVKVNRIEGEKLEGLLTAVDEDAITIHTVEKRRIEGRKKKETVENDVRVAFDQIKATKVIIQFK